MRNIVQDSVGSEVRKTIWLAGCRLLSRDAGLGKVIRLHLRLVHLAVVVRVPIGLSIHCRYVHVSARRRTIRRCQITPPLLLFLTKQRRLGGGCYDELGTFKLPLWYLYFLFRFKVVKPQLICKSAMFLFVAGLFLFVGMRLQTENVRVFQVSVRGMYFLANWIRFLEHVFVF